MKRTMVLAIVLLFGAATAAHGQDRPKEGPVTSESALDWDKVKKQVLVGLELPYEGAREQVLKNTIVFATFFRDRMDLGVAVAPITRLCEEGDAELKVLAFAALHAIGNSQARSYLADRATPEESRRSMQLFMAVLEETMPTLQAVGTL